MMFRTLLLLIALGALSSAFASTALAQEEACVPGDELLVLVPQGLDVEEFEVQVGMDHTVTLGWYGSVSLEGTTPGEARERIATHLSTYLSSTEGVWVTRTSRGRLVRVTGHVESPGVVRLHAVDGVVEAIAAAGGARDGADLRHVRRLRDGASLALDPARVTEPEVLAAGDVLVVDVAPGASSASGSGEIFYDDVAAESLAFVTGAVAQPGPVRRTADLTVLAAVALAGGPTAEADLARVTVIGDAGRSSVDLTLLGDAARDAILVPRTGAVVIHVPWTRATPGETSSHEAIVVGAVRGEGRIALGESVSLVESLALAGGLDTNADVRRIRHVQTGPGWALSASYNVAGDNANRAERVSVSSGDTVWVPRKEGNVWRTAGRTLSDVALLTAAVAAFRR